MKTNERLTYGLLSAFSSWIGRFRSETRHKTSYYIFKFLYDWLPLRKALALKNIKYAFPDKDHAWHEQLLKRSYQFFSRNFIEFFALPHSYFSAKYIIKGKDQLDHALAENKGVIMVAGHFGPWEMLAAWIGYNNYQFSGVAQRQSNRGSDKFFSEIRGASGIHHIFRKSNIDTMYKVLTDGHILGLVNDQDARKRGVLVDFFGLPSSTSKGAAIFLQKTEAPIIFVSVIEMKMNVYEIEFIRVNASHKDDVAEITQKFTSYLELAIRKNPEQYFWFHNRWKSTRKLFNAKKD